MGIYLVVCRGSAIQLQRLLDITRSLLTQVCVQPSLTRGPTRRPLWLTVRSTCDRSQTAADDDSDSEEATDKLRQMKGTLTMRQLAAFV